VTLLGSAPGNYGMTGGVVEVRLDSPKGELIGTTPAITPQNLPADALPSAMKPSIAVAQLKPTQGKHDVYFVCKNEKSDGQGLFVMMQLMFQGAGKPTM
jgi:cytochrome c